MWVCLLVVAAVSAQGWPVVWPTIPAAEVWPVVAPPAPAKPDEPLSPYERARQEHLRTGRPLWVLIGSKTCGPCKAARKLLRAHWPSVYLDAEDDAAVVVRVAGRIPPFVPELVIFHAKPELHSEVLTSQKLLDRLRTQEPKP